MNAKGLLRHKAAWVTAASLLMFAVFFDPIVRLGLVVVSNRYYRTETNCDAEGRNCVAITYESQVALNSEIKKYFFTDGWLKIPELNKRYIMFEDGVEFCFVRMLHGRYEIHSTAAPAVNNLAGIVELSPLKFKDSACSHNTY
jgi:hypothetical protein